LGAGADKISINSATVQNPKSWKWHVSLAPNIVVAVLLGSWAGLILMHGGRKATARTQAGQRGMWSFETGEVCLPYLDTMGQKPNKVTSEAVYVPVIASAQEIWSIWRCVYLRESKMQRWLQYISLQRNSDSVEKYLEGIESIRK
jgi:imidazole glycerol phosphate synthase subunit HisF